MKRGHLLWEITTWEFWRWFKLKDQIWTLVLSLVIGTAVWGGRAWLDRRAQAPVTLAVVNADELVAMFPEESRVRPRPSTPQMVDDLMLQLEREEIDGVLVFVTPDSAQLTVRNRPSWATDLTESLSEIRVAQRLSDARLEPELVASMLAPVSIQIDLTQGRNTSRSQAITAAVLVSLMTLGVVLGLSYQFVAITGEKQLRVTEQIISAVSPQTWIDGKVLGVSLLSLASSLNFLASLVIFLFLSQVFGGSWFIPWNAISWTTGLLMLPVALAGFFFWNVLFAAIAATINDPNTSSRSIFLILPLLPLGAALAMMGNAESGLAQLLAIFPLTSPSFLGLRLALVDVPLWEILASLTLLAISIGFLRRMAGKIFATAILMYGKEPTWREMARWLRAT